MKRSVIVTVPPYAPFLGEVARHPIVSGLRLNTVMPIKGEPGPVLERLASLGQPLHVDLKARQLRVAEAAIPPFTSVRLTHEIRLATPCQAYFSDGRESATVLEVDGDRLILADSPRRFVGPGESINIPGGSLEVLGTLTQKDEAYVLAARELGLHDFMVSFVESPLDLAAVRALDPLARLTAKIESRRGLAYAKEHGAKAARLMAARGDLYVEVARPHEILGAVRDVLAADGDAIVASRILPSLAQGLEPSAQDLSDVAWLLSLGYRTFLLGDEVCLRRESVVSALNLLETLFSELP